MQLSCAGKFQQEQDSRTPASLPFRVQELSSAQVLCPSLLMLMAPPATCTFDREQCQQQESIECACTDHLCCIESVPHRCNIITQNARVQRDIAGVEDIDGTASLSRFVFHKHAAAVRPHAQNSMPPNLCRVVYQRAVAELCCGLPERNGTAISGSACVVVCKRAQSKLQCSLVNIHCTAFNLQKNCGNIKLHEENLAGRILHQC